MSLSTAQTAQIYEIMGLPQNGAGDVAQSAATLFGPVFETYDFSALVTRLNARLAALSADQITRVATLLSRWDAMTSSSPLRVLSQSGAAGVLSDHEKERANIREALANLIGFALPSGGFAAEVGRAARMGGTVVR